MASNIPKIVIAERFDGLTPEQMAVQLNVVVQRMTEALNAVIDRVNSLP